MKSHAFVTACVVSLVTSFPAHAQSTAAVVDITTGFVPVANDIPIMLGAGVRFARVHEVWGRFGYFPTGDDRRFAFGVLGYRVAFRPNQIVRPVVGGLIAGLPTTCTHDANHNQNCEQTPLFIFSATAGVRFEPTPWLGISTMLSLGVDSYPNPFGMVEVGVSFFIPL
jgi:hypothetical protein